jgi:hypothetical protein
MRSRRPGTLAAVGAVLVLSSIPAGSSQAAPAAELVGYEAVASGKAFTAFPSVPALLPVDAPAEGTLSLATATLSTGGQGFGRASTFFPGTPIAGIRPLIEVASGQRLPIPDYPVVVESREFEDGKADDHPGVTMSSDVDPDRAVVIADAGATEVAGALALRSSRTLSTSARDGSVLSATSTSIIEGLTLAGVVAVETVTSTAAVTTDAVKAECSGSVALGGVTVAGQPATIDAEGIHLADQPAVPGLAAGTAAQDALAASGVTVRVLGGEDACEGPGGTRTSGGLLISVPIPEAGSIPPGGHLDVVLASTSATVGASTLPPFAPPPFAAPPVMGDVVTRVPGPAAGAALEPVAPPAASGPAAEGGPASLPPADEVSRYAFAGVPAPLVLGVLLLASPVARRLRRYMARALALAAGA